MFSDSLTSDYNSWLFNIFLIFKIRMKRLVLVEHWFICP